MNLNHSAAISGADCFTTDINIDMVTAPQITLPEVCQCMYEAHVIIMVMMMIIANLLSSQKTFGKAMLGSLVRAVTSPNQILYQQMHATCSRTIFDRIKSIK